jgi:hypothetical protein
MKMGIGRIHPTADLSNLNKKIIKILGVMRQMLLPPTVVSAFRPAGIFLIFDQEHKCLVCSVDPRQTHCVRGLDLEQVRDAVRRAGVPVDFECHFDTRAHQTKFTEILSRRYGGVSRYFAFLSSILHALKIEPDNQVTTGNPSNTEEEAKPKRCFVFHSLS